MTAGWVLDPKLEADSFALVDWPLCHVRLMNDARFPWLVLVPRMPGAVEPFDLGADDQLRLWRETMHAGARLKAHAGALKINVGALGNIVRQLHVHVVARVEGDAAWPGPVWGAGTAVRLAPGDALSRIGTMREALGHP